MLSRRSFVKGIFVGAAGLGLESCARKVNFVLPENYSQSEEKTPTEVELIKFQDYHPESNKKKIEFNDSILMDYITKGFSASQLESIVNGSVWNYEESESFLNDPKSKIDIKGYEKFKEEILSAAKTIGISPQELQNASIHDSIMYCGQITAKQLSYEKRMISEMEKGFNALDPDTKLKILRHLAITKKSMQNELANKIDNMSKDEIFSFARGVCRNYSGVNAAVFKVLKDMNSNLKNTYMAVNTRETLEETLSLSHSWNRVSTVYLKNNQIEILMTQVDPTWLDTRRITIDNTGKRTQRPQEEVYNAIDEKHYGELLIYAKKGIASLYELLQRNRSVSLNKELRISQESEQNYRNKALDIRMQICSELLDIASENREKFGEISYHFAESFTKGVETALVGKTSLLIAMESLLYCSTKENFKKVERIYNKAVKVIPDVLAEENIDLQGKEGNKYISINTLYQKTKNAFQAQRFI